MVRRIVSARTTENTFHMRGFLNDDVKFFFGIVCRIWMHHHVIIVIKIMKGSIILYHVTEHWLLFFEG